MRNDFIGKICPYCRSVLSSDDAIVTCSVCDMPHHLSCWQENKGCTSFGCSGEMIAVSENCKLSSTTTESNANDAVVDPVPHSFTVAKETESSQHAHTMSFDEGPITQLEASSIDDRRSLVSSDMSNSMHVSEPLQAVNNALGGKKKRFCNRCGGLIDAKTKKCTSCEKEAVFSPRKNILIVSTLLVVAVLTGLNLLQYFIHSKEIEANNLLISNYEREISAFEEEIIAKDTAIDGFIQEIKTKDSTISYYEKNIKEKDTTISSQKSKISTLEPKSKNYDAICKLVDSGTIGYASGNFKVSEGIIILRKNVRNKKFTLTTGWKKGATISVSYSSSSAYVSFDRNSWHSSTTLTVVPVSEGVTVVTFKNSINTQTFKMIIIVVG